MRPTPPRRVTMDGTKIEVRVLHELGKFPQGYSVGGEYSAGVVRLSSAQTLRGLQCALLHELLHAAWQGAHIKGFNVKQEEYILFSLDSFIATLLRENPELVEFLTAPS